jgi:hypothetical protein
VLQQLGGLWRQLRGLSPVVQVLVFLAPVVVVALIVLGGLVVWTVAKPAVAVLPQPTLVVQAAGTPVPGAPAANERTVIATATQQVALLPTVLVPTPEPTREPTQTPTPEPMSTPTPEPARSARVINTEGQGANMRRAPSVSAQRVKLLLEGTVVELVGGEQRGDGYTWRTVSDVEGNKGYVITDYLQPIQGPPGATPVLPPPSIQVDEITSPAERGGEATLKIITRPGVRCELRVLVFGPETQPADGLEPKTADPDGVCSWTWTVPEEVLPGVWRYRISAGEGEGRATREVPVTIS